MGYTHFSKVTAGSVDSTGAVTAGSVDSTGAVTAGSVASTGAVTAGSVASTGAVTAGEFATGAVGSEVYLTASMPEINNAADVSARVQSLIASGAITPGIQSVELDNDTVAIDSTIADSAYHQGLFVVKDTSASGTTAVHTITLTIGTFDGTNNIATMDAPNDALIIYFDSVGNGTIVANIGAVVLS